MVFCCVPGCGTDSGRCDPSITFHEIPLNPVVATKWINQVSAAIKGKWIPKGADVFCSKHFLQTDFKDNTDALKPFCVPTIFGHKFIGEDASVKETVTGKESTSSPLIVKVATPRPHAVLKNVSPNSISRSAGSTPIRNLGPSSIRPSNAGVRSVGLFQVRPVSTTVQTVGLSPIRPTSFAVQSVGHSPVKPVNPAVQNVGPNSIRPVSNVVRNVPLSPIRPENTDIRTMVPVFFGPQNKSVKNVSPVTASSTQPRASAPFITIDSVSSLAPNRNLINSAANSIGSSEENQFKIKTIFQRSSLKEGPKEAASVQSSSDEINSCQVKPPLKRSLNNDSAKSVSRKKEKINEDLIEIGPNTFLKINPDIIKVNKKLTPSGNTVLQFLMDPKVANGSCGDLLPKIVQGPLVNKVAKTASSVSSGTKPSDESDKNGKDSGTDQSKSGTVQHVLGHLVDTHDCQDSCSDSNNVEMIDDSPHSPSSGNASKESRKSEESASNQNKPETDSSFLDKAPVLLTTKMPISHCFNDKPKYLLQLKQKGRQIAALKSKIANMQKKIDDLEDRCIVQERQLSYSFIKNLKNIRKNAAKGDACATYILEQIRSYTDSYGQKMRWSDSTLAQCAIWCRKAPYAYEYFKKAEFFKLPCLGTVKRFMKKHPDVNALKKIVPNPQVDDGSSSDFEFDESDTENKGLSEDENTKTPSSVSSKANKSKENENQANEDHDASNVEAQNSNSMIDTNDSTKSEESQTAPSATNDSKVEVQEIMLPSGEVLQCLSSDLGSSADGQYFIIPNMGDQNVGGDQEYSIVSADSLPVILQNIDSAQHEQLIFIANAANQIDCNETVIPS